MLNNPVTVEISEGISDEWLASILDYTFIEPSRQRGNTRNRNVGSPKLGPQLPLLALSPWRSFGGYLDYREWPARERFMALDKAIACTPAKHDPRVFDVEESNANQRIA